MLQKLAKEHSIPANLKREMLLKKIIEALDVPKCDTAVIEVDDGGATEAVETDVVESEEVAPEAEEKGKVAPTLIEPPLKEGESETTHVDEEGDDDNTDPYDEGSESAGEEDSPSPEERVGGKLLGIATPAGRRHVLESPAASKSGTKPYERYNVHWTYDDYENGPENTTHAQYEGNEEGTDSPTREGQKLRGVATPIGKSTSFPTPTKTTEKEYLKYNVHWQ